MDPVVLGRIHGLFGIRGWVKVYSYTDPPENILAYARWLVRRGGDWQAVRVADGRMQGKGLVAHLAPGDGEPLPDRDAAAMFLDAEIAVAREDLPPPPEDRAYWVDLVDCAVETIDGIPLGRVANMMDTGAHTVLVVTGERERLIPLVRGPIVQAIDLEAGRITVDWDPDF